MFCEVAFSCLPASGMRQSSIFFTCNQTAGHGTPQLLSETDGCSATFQWNTSAVCPPRKMECKLVSQHLTFDLRTLSSLTEPWKFSHRGDSYVLWTGSSSSCVLSEPQVFLQRHLRFFSPAFVSAGILSTCVRVSTLTYQVVQKKPRCADKRRLERPTSWAESLLRK